MTLRSLVAYAERLGFLPAYSYFRRIATGSQIAIMMYHRVSPVQSNVLVPSLTPELFERQIMFLKENFQVISLDSLSDLLTSPEKLPKKAVVITFDDGYKDNFTYAYPILKKHGVSATIFLTTGVINAVRPFWWEELDYLVENSLITGRIVLQGFGEFSLHSKSDKTRAKIRIADFMKRITYNERQKALNELALNVGKKGINDVGKDMLLSWAEIKEMATNGITFGAHTVNHPILTTMPIELCRREIVQSKKDIEAVLGAPVTSFAYPNGSCNCDIIRIVRESGFTCAVTTRPYGLIGKRDNVFALRRIDAPADFDVFKGLLSGMTGDLGFLYNN